MQASIELWEHTKMLTKTDKESFAGGLNQWYDKWKDFLNERSSATIKKKSTYKHKRLRSAYNSLKRNLPYLFIWYDFYELYTKKTGLQNQA
jgi:flagellar hook-associated protein FlgK